MDRRKFDSWLLSLIPPAVEVRTGCRLKSFVRADRGFSLNLEAGQQAYVEKAQILVGADGANSRVRIQAFPDLPSPDAYFAIQEWVEREGDDFPYFTALFDREITDYYCWTIPKGDTLIIGAALPPRDQAREKFERLKIKLRAHGFVFGKTIRREGPSFCAPAEGNTFPPVRMESRSSARQEGGSAPVQPKGSATRSRAPFFLPGLCAPASRVSRYVTEGKYGRCGGICLSRI